VRTFQKYVEPARPRLFAPLVPPTHVLLETTGRRTGRPRQNPVGNGLDGDTLWIVAEQAQRQLRPQPEADPRCV
jgi:hypothetical protein